MRILNYVRDAKRMELTELQAIDKRVRAVQANNEPDEPINATEPEVETTEEAPKKTARQKKSKERI